MSFLLWQRDRAAGITASRLVLRAAEVPLLHDAQALCERLHDVLATETSRIDQASRVAHEQGHATGLAQGTTDGREQVAAALTTLAAAAATEREQLRAQVAALALQVARKMIGSLSEDERMVALAEAAAAELIPGARLTLVVHPDQLDAVRHRLAARATAAAGDAPLPFDLRGEPACAPDACLIDTGLGSIDAGLDTQLNRLAQAWGVTVTAEGGA